MHFVISKNELAQLITKIQNTIPQKPTVPILANVLVEAFDGEVVFTATDLTIGTRFCVPARVMQTGSTTLPGKRFFQLVRELTALNLEVRTNEQDISEITANSSRFKLNGMNKRDFPHLPDLSGAVKIKIPGDVLKGIISKVTFSAARDDSRHALNGVLLEIGDTEFSFVTTDGKRLSKMSTKLEIDSQLSRSHIIPLKAVEEIGSMIDEKSAATFYLMDDKIAVESNQGLIITKLLSGDYPDYRRVIPSDTTTSVVLHREELISLLRQVSLFTSETSSSVKFTLLDGELYLTANNAEIGEGKVSMPANYKGPQLDIAFNPIFFLDILRHSKQETVTMSLIDAYNPALITDGSTALFVLMPMRIMS